MYIQERVWRSVGCVLVGLLCVTGCGDDPAPSNNNTTPDMNNVTTNQAPVAAAGDNRNVVVGQRVTADGSASADPDGDVIMPTWTLKASPAGSQAMLEAATSFTPSFVPDLQGVYTLELVVNDGTVNSEPSRVSFNARPSGPNRAPVASAGADRTVVLGESVMLDGAGSTDPDGDMLTYAWQIKSAPAGSTAQIAGATMRAATFVPDVAGAYTLTLVVNDGQVDSAADELVLMVMPDVPPNARPVADAGMDRAGTLGVELMLDGSGSSDADGDTLTYAWALVTRPAASQAALTGADQVQAVLVPDVGGRYIVELIVDDGIEASLPDRVTIDVQGAGANPPVALIRGPRTALLGRPIQLDGTGSTDADGDPLTYIWTLKSKPAGSFVFLSGASSAMPTLTPDVAGDYVVSLKVNDGLFDSQVVELTIAASNDPFAGQCLIISEYIEGTGNNKALEVFNCSSGETLDLARYGVCLVTNNSSTCMTTVKLMGMLAPGDVFGICNSQIAAMIPAGGCDMNSGITAFNGDDRLIIFEDVDGDGSFAPATDKVMDTFGQVSMAPASRIWEDVTYRRCDFSPFDGTQNMFSADALYTEAAADDFSNLGTAPTMGCVTDRPPVANAGSNQTVVLGDTVMLDGAGSIDPDGQMLTYTWTISNAPQGSTAMLMGADMAQASFVPDVDGAYTVTLVVNDGMLNSAPVNVTITVNPVPNLRPVAVAGMNQSFPGAPATVMLDGSGSSDPESQPITYTWTLVTRPMGSAAMLATTTAAQTGFMADVDGLYIAELVVNDGVQNSLPSRVNVQVGVVQNCLIISEVVEGASLNKALELFNCGGAPFDLSGIGLCVHFNGGASCTGVDMLSGTVAPGAVFTLCNSGIAAGKLPMGYTCNKTLPSAGQNPVTFNGDDAIVLFRDANGSMSFNAGDTILDAFGKPATVVSPAPWADKTFRRCDRTPYTGQGDFTAASYYSQHAADDFSDIGTAPTAMMCAMP